MRFIPQYAAAVLLAVAICIGGCGGAAPVPPVFTKANYTMESARKAERESKKPLFVMATASWCGPCQELKRGALVDSELAAYIEEKTLPVYLDVDENEGVAAELSVMSIPTLFVIRDGKVVSKLGGVKTAAELKSWLEAAVAQK